MLETIIIPAGKDRTREATSLFWSDVKWRTIHCILGQKNTMSISEIAKATGLSVEEAVLALEGMEAIGLLQRTDQGYKATVDSVKRNFTSLSERESKIRDFAVASYQVINKLLENPDNIQNFTRRVVYNSNAETVNELIESINKAIDVFKEKSDNSTPDGVYALSMAMTPMTQKGIYE